jgi:exodeoxyribonuclease V alpha subunit
VLKASIEGSRQACVLVGALSAVHEGDTLEVEGEEVEHPRFGPQVKVIRYLVVQPSDAEGIVRYLSAGRIKGLGPKTAAKIAAHFGAATLDILEHQPERLLEVRGVRPALVEAVRLNLQENRQLRELTVQLAPLGIGVETVLRIMQAFGAEAGTVVTRAPYALIGRVRGIGFRTADIMARGAGIPEDDPLRLRAGLRHLLEQAENGNGDMCVPEAWLLEQAERLLNVSAQSLLDELERLLAMGQLRRDEEPERMLMQPAAWEAEWGTAMSLFQLTRPIGPKPDPIDFESVFQALALELTEEQKQAVQAAVGNRVTIISGGPGTGKTTIIRAIIEVLKGSRRHALIAAPTGRAAKRIEESSNYPAATIHRLLRFNPENGAFQHNRGNPLRTDVVIIDECSMVDAYLFYSLLQALATGTRLVLIGDRDQLPSVGPGNVLRDLIGCGLFPTLFLERNFRQGGDSLIVENAYRVNHGTELLAAADPTADFMLLPVRSEAEALRRIEAIVGHYADRLPFNSSDMQILVPMYRGEAGIDRVNQRIQELFNPGDVLVKRERAIFKRFDKVMQLRNDYEKEVFNGDLGLAVEWDGDKRQLIVDFDGRFVTYAGDELDELSLAYAVSVHKSQGSEYDTVVLTLLPAHARMLSRELLYTAITRARRRLILLSDEATVARACANARPRLRRTMLTVRLAAMFKGDAAL